MSWFTRLLPKVSTRAKKGVPEGIWSKCDQCNSILYRKELSRHLQVCPKCNHHMRLSARDRLTTFLDKGHVSELATKVRAVDLLKFKDSKKYKERLSEAQNRSQETEALLVMEGGLHGLPVVAISFDFNFIGGSMGTAVGERFLQGVEHAIENKIPVICFSTSGGARMQEGLFSLFQMSKTAAVLARLGQQQLPYISILTNPTMGGVSASLATLGDIIIAEPKALIGFSGPRVIEQTIREVLPEGFQRSEFLLEHGAIDMIVHRHQLRNTVTRLLSQMLDKPTPQLDPLPTDQLVEESIG